MVTRPSLTARAVDNADGREWGIERHQAGRFLTRPPEPCDNCPGDRTTLGKPLGLHVVAPADGHARADVEPCHRTDASGGSRSLRPPTVRPVEDLLIEPATVPDCGELLTLQRAAYVTEAQLYGDVRLPALTQTLDELRTELQQGLAYKATDRGRIVGAVRASVQEATLHIGRLTVAPDQQGRGIGSALLVHAEARAPADVVAFALFTGHRSVANLRLYERHGYEPVRREALHEGVTLVHLQKLR